MNKTVYCFGVLSDKTFLHTVDRVADAAARVYIFDTRLLLQHGANIERSADGHISISCQEYGSIHIDKNSPILCRLLDVSNRAQTPEQFLISRSVYETLIGVLKIHEGQVVFRPVDEQSNFSKLLHNRIGTGSGFAVPFSILTNRTCLFHDQRQGMEDFITKGCSSFKTEASGIKHSNIPSDVRLASPALIQERVYGIDVRVHLVGGNIFAEGIYSDCVDYRFARHRRGKNIYARTVVPDSVADGIRKIGALTGIDILGIDFKVDIDNGHWYFLEANSLPCYEGYDRRLGFEISSAITEYLLDAQVG